MADPPRINPFEPRANPFETPPPPKVTISRENTGAVDESVAFPSPLPRTLAGAVSEGVGKAGTQIVDAVKDVPAAIGRAVDDPLGYAKAAANIPISILKSTLGVAGLPWTMGTYGGLKLGESVGAITPETTKKFHDEYVKPGTDVIDDLQGKYGSWLGGPGDLGFTPDKGYQNLLKTVGTRPLEVVADVAPTAGALLTKAIPRVKVPDVQSATLRLNNLGIDASRLTAQQIDDLRQRGNTIGWDKDKMEREYRSILFKDAGIEGTESMLSGNPQSRYIEDRMRNGQMGPEAMNKMYENDLKIAEQVNNYTDTTRATMTGSAVRMEPVAIGETITQRFNVADDAAAKVVGDNYRKAFDQAELATHGIPSHVPEADVRGLPNAINAKMSGHPTHPFVATKETAPNAYTAAKTLEEFSKTGRLPNFIDGDPLPPNGAAGISWESADTMRKHLVGLRESARNNPTDYLAMNRVIDAFDTQFGKSNPLLNDARKSHAERMQTFHPSLHRAGDDIVKATKALSEEQNNGIKQFNKLFSGEFKRGEAIDAVNHLKTIFANDPAAMTAIKEGALERLFVNPQDYKHLSPQRMATAVEQALNGPQAAIYRTLFTPDELAALRRHHDVVGQVGKNMKPINPPGSGHEVVIETRKNEMRRSAAELVSGLLGAGAAGLGWAAGDGAVGAGSGAVGFGVGRFAGTPMGDIYRRVIADPQGARDAGKMSFPDPQTRSPLLNKRQLGALSAAGAAATVDDSPRARARGGILRRAGHGR